MIDCIKTIADKCSSLRIWGKQGRMNMRGALREKQDFLRTKGVFPFVFVYDIMVRVVRFYWKDNYTEYSRCLVWDYWKKYLVLTAIKS